jgi:hypothetical protein
MLRRLGLGISYFLATVYIFSILLPCLYCFQNGCRGPGELDAFMPAFLLTPAGAIATAFWPLAVIFAIVLLGVITFVAWMVYETAFHRFHR